MVYNSPCKNTEVGSIPFSRGSFQPRDQTQVSCIAGRFSTVWATREAPYKTKTLQLFFPKTNSLHFIEDIRIGLKITMNNPSTIIHSH